MNDVTESEEGFRLRQSRPNKYGPKDFDYSDELSSIIASDSSFEHKMERLDDDKIVEMAANA